jgi:hypothetical protein
MFDILSIVEKKLPDLLNKPDIWASVYVDYHLPFVQRLYTKFQEQETEYRIYLHRILPCELKDCLFHPHPWPSIIKILNGQYDMQLGFGAGMEPPAVASTLILNAGTIYEMINRDSWHAVCPINELSYSLMVTGTPWERESHKSTKKLSPLIPIEKEQILEFFKNYYQ